MIHNYHRLDKPAWARAVTTGLRDAIAQYTAIWFPDAWNPCAPGCAAGRTVQPASAAPVTRNGTRAR
ncbi:MULTISPECIES: hypothetical protein [unclassified Streptomyces]|uniref:hypothetical protein n=1 Tax=unclassified Streptomyces TaxID=2593676 RepID=UPI0033330A93